MTKPQLLIRRPGGEACLGASYDLCSPFLISSETPGDYGLVKRSAGQLRLFTVNHLEQFQQFLAGPTCVAAFGHHGEERENPRAVHLFPGMSLRRRSVSILAPSANSP